MDWILMDIQKFLKKLETGQLEIEAGQWELHKDITNLKNSVQGLKELKTDLQLMRKHGLKQTDLMKELQCKLKVLEEIHNSKDHRSTSLSRSQLFQNQFINCSLVPKTKKKIRNHSQIVLRSRKIIGHRSQHSISKRQSMIRFKPKNEIEIIMSKDGKQKKVLGDSSQALKRLKLKNTSLNLKSPSLSLDILQRYLNDSKKYRNKTMPRINYPKSKKSIKNRKPKTAEPAFQCKGFGISPKLKNNQQDQSKARIGVKNRAISANPEKYDCFNCSKKLPYKDDVLSRERINQITKPFYTCHVCKKCFFCKSLLKKHEKFHQKMSKCFRGFRCSYCDKICKSPEKLTAHLKSCRIITRAHSRKK